MLDYFGIFFCADESRCIEKEEQRFSECEDVARILNCAEKLLEHMDIPLVSTPCPAEKHDTRTRHPDGIDFKIVNFASASSWILFCFLLCVVCSFLDSSMY